MALPFILSLLGSGLAGAGALGTGILASPLVAGAIGSGLGTAIETGDLGAGIKSGLTAGLLGGIGGALVGRMGGAAAGDAAAAAGEGATGFFANMPSGFTAPASPVLTGATMGERFGQIGAGAGQVPLGEVLGGGFNQGIMTGAGLGTALGGMAMTQPAQFPGQGEGEDIPQAAPANRTQYRPGPTYRPGFDPEFLYFAPQIPGAVGYAEGGPVTSANPEEEEEEKRRMLQLQIPELNMGLAKAISGGDYGLIQQLSGGNMGGLLNMAGGGRVRYTPAGMSAPMYMQAGGIADAMPGAEIEPNDKQVIRDAIEAIKGRMGEQESAIALARFLQQYGEEELRNLVDDVRSGKADGERGDVEGTIEGAGDGMSDMVPAKMDDGSQDVLLSDGEFVVPADVVSGIGNGSTDAGADELYDMMDRVRMERTGKREQPEAIAAGGLLPA